MHEFQAIKQEFNLWMSLLQSQGAQPRRLEATSDKTVLFGALHMNKARPVYLSQLMKEVNFG